MANTAKKKVHDDGEIPELTEAQLRGAKRGRSRYADRRAELPLSGIRKAVGRTQLDMADGGLAQSEVSRLEHADVDTTQVSTLRRYASALGGELELTIVVDGRRFVVGPTKAEAS